MKLRWAPGSPFVRKVTVTAIEAGLDDRIERMMTDYHKPDSDIIDQNPLGKVPAMILDDGDILIDSSVICAYLDSLHDFAVLPVDEVDLVQAFLALGHHESSFACRFG